MLCSVAWKIQDSYLLAWVLLDCGLPPCAQIGRSQHLWGPLIIIPLQQFCHMHGRPGASRAIRDSERLDQKKSPLASRISSRETGCQVTVWLLPGDAVLGARVDSRSFLHGGSFFFLRIGVCVLFYIAENRLTQRCRENQSSRTFSSPVTKGHLPPPSEAHPCPLALAETLVMWHFLEY